MVRRPRRPATPPTGAAHIALPLRAGERSCAGSRSTQSAWRSCGCCWLSCAARCNRANSRSGGHGFGDLRLLRFQGNPHELTPKARAHQQFGYKPPFDRHDWVVERCGREVRYLIDFYQGRASAGHAVSVHIDARPAADTLSDAWDRVRMAVRAVVS